MLQGNHVLRLADYTASSDTHVFTQVSKALGLPSGLPLTQLSVALTVKVRRKGQRPQPRQQSVAAVCGPKSSRKLPVVALQSSRPFERRHDSSSSI